jgi:hypothetical protein
MAYTNAAGYWMGLQQTAYSMIDEEIAGATTDEARTGIEAKIGCSGHGPE